MAKAYVKIRVRPGKEMSVRDRLRAISTVKSADLTAGQQDIIALIETEKGEGLFEFVVEKIRKIDGIEETITNLVLE